MERPRALKTYLRTLRGQTLLAVVGIHAVMIPLFFGGVVFFVKHSLTEDFVNRTRSEAHLFASLAASGGVAHLDRVFHGAAASGQLLSVELVSMEDRVLWQLDPSGDGAPRPGFVEDFFFGQNDDAVYHIAAPVFDAEGEPVAQLRLGFDERPTLAQIAAVQRRTAVLTLSYLALTLLLAGYWIHRLNRPMRELGIASRRVASGDFDAPISVHTGLHEVLALASDINHMRGELVRSAASLRHMATHDALTGLPNRMLLIDRVEQAMQRARGEGSGFALLLMDLDHFKEINDTLGHPAGDQVLAMIPQRMLPLLRPGDTMARLGGDEFAFLLVGAGAVEAHRVIRRIVEAMRRPFEVHEQALHLGQSIGVALYPDHAQEFEELLRQADIAMYAAKQNRQASLVFSPDIDPHSRERLALASDLRRDIELGRLRVHYQPQMRVRDGSLCAVEALVRWEHPLRGEVAPDEFVPLAERLGLMDALTRDVVRQVVRDRTATPELAGITLCINIAASNVRDPTFPDVLADALREAGLHPGEVVLEITENECMFDVGDALQQLASLRALGFGLAIDDFGMGHSSFQYLKHLPATEVKIDRSFVADMARDRHDHSLVAAVVALGRQLGLSVVAEGVQDAATLELLVALGCERVQGFHVARPMPIEALAVLLREPERRDGAHAPARVTDRAGIA